MPILSKESAPGLIIATGTVFPSVAALGLGGTLFSRHEELGGISFVDAIRKKWSLHT